ETLADLLPGDVRPAVERMESGDLSAVERLLASERWSARFRVIPFSSIGRRHGLLIGFRPDAVRLVWEGRPTPAGDCILAVCKGPLDPDGSYRALVHPDLLRTVLAGDAREEPAAQYFSRRPRTGDAPSHYYATLAAALVGPGPGPPDHAAAGGAVHRQHRGAPAAADRRGGSGADGPAAPRRRLGP